MTNYWGRICLYLTSSLLVTELLDVEYKEYVKECDDIVDDSGGRVPNDYLLKTLKRLSMIPMDRKEVLYAFWEKIVPVVDGVHKWSEKKKFVKNARPSMAFSVSDESFALVVIENNFSRWVDEHRKSKLIDDIGKDCGTRKGLGTIKPLYTNENGTRGGKGGWYGEGMMAFNRAFQVVLEDRKKTERENLETDFVTVWLARGNKGVVARRVNAEEGLEGPKRSLETSMFASLLALEDEHDAHEMKRNLLDVTNVMEL
jgi:hypothetical protein